MQIKWILAAVALNASFLSVSHATDAVELAAVKVEYRDLNLSHPQGEAVLYQRIRQAAGQVCRSVDPTAHENTAFRLQYLKLHDACLHNAVEGAVSGINRPQFTQFVASQQRHESGTDIVMASK